MSGEGKPSRRELLGAGGALLALGCTGPRRRVVPAAPAALPQLTHGVQSGDPARDGAVIWARADRPARLVVEWATRARGPWTRAAPVAVTPASDLTGRVVLTGLPPGQTIHYRVTPELEASRGAGTPVAGRFRTVADTPAPVRLIWSGDTCGQGFGIDLAGGGLKIHAAIAAQDPDLFLHAGDLFYADNVIEPERRLADGRVRRHLVTPATSRVADSLAGFRGHAAYHLLDEHVRRLAAQVPLVAQWDDHEVYNNWFPGDVLADPRYAAERRADVLAAWARQAFDEFTPRRPGPIHRRVPWGPLCELFLVDLRSFRGPLGPGDEPGGAPMLGAAQLDALLAALRSSRARWKIVAIEQPLTIMVRDGATRHVEAWAQGDPGAPRGRERELEALLVGAAQAGVRDLVFLSADVHFASAMHCDPARAAVGGFAPFWEFVAGALHAGAFAGEAIDATFGPEVRFSRAPPATAQNAPPEAGYGNFGALDIDPASGVLTVRFHGDDGAVWWETRIEPTA